MGVKLEENFKKLCREMLLYSEEKISLLKERKRFMKFLKNIKTSSLVIEDMCGTLILLKHLSSRISLSKLKCQSMPLKPERNPVVPMPEMTIQREMMLNG